MITLDQIAPAHHQRTQALPAMLDTSMLHEIRGTAQRDMIDRGQDLQQEHHCPVCDGYMPCGVIAWHKCPPVNRLRVGS